ncbi:MAG TPA: DUF1538 domain-containing protein, partial [Gammaproteobacteria bacterium]|nr:DUF1538 domain-containing protein [Gammaproteobacteria bacterium]
MATEHKVRFGAFIREITTQQRYLSYSVLAPSIESEAERVAHRQAKLQLRSLDVYRLVQPYVSVRFRDQAKAVVPLAAYLVLFQLLILRQNVTDSWIITGGLAAVIIGLMLFMEGLKVGLMPFGETIGSILPSKAPLPAVLLITFLLGIGVTFAEPAIGALKAAGAIVNVEKTPYLYALLNNWSGRLVLVVGIGVGLAAVLGTLRFIYGWSLKPLIYAVLAPLIGLTFYFAADPELRHVLGLAWDCGAVTTGPVTVPLVLALGIGMATSAGRGRSSLSGFGIVTLASLFPILAVYGLALFVASVEDVDSIIAAASVAAVTESAPWHARTPMLEVVSGARAILPLVLFLFLVMRFVLHEKIRHPANIAYGITLAVVGMVIFNVGLSYGLAKLGGQSGGLVPSAFTTIEVVPDSPLYDVGLGIGIAAVFAWVLGFGATMAEPALNALGMTVESLSNGAFRKSMLINAVSVGVGTGIALGILKIVFSLPIAVLIIPGYTIAVVLTAISTEEYVNIAWDSAGVTTGPVTVPLVLAMGLGLGGAVGAADGFGILAMASIGPIVSVLATGQWVRWKIAKRRRAEHWEEEQAV